jgi:ABC-type Fe3+-hydroxamate transport system substrate-binding protein
MTTNSKSQPVARINAAWLQNAWIRLTDVQREYSVSATHRLLFAHASSCLAIVFTGQNGDIIIDGLLRPAAADKVYFAQPGQRVELHGPYMEAQTCYIFHFTLYQESADISERNDQMTFSPFVPVSLSALPRLAALASRIAEHWHSGDAIDQLVSQAGFQELLHLLYKKQGQHEEALDQVYHYISLHYREPLTVEALAELAGMSRFYFMRSFKERFNQSAMELVATLRTNQAKTLLEQGYPLADIVELIGYKDPQYFSSQFHKQVGIPPRTYGANRQLRVAAYSWPNIGHLLTLQIVPCAAPIDQFWSEDYRKKFRFDIKEPLSHDYAFNLEALQRARPQRIIALDEVVPEEEKEKLRQIAPVLFLPWHTGSWREHLRLTADFLGREQAAEKWLLRYDRQASAVRERLPSVLNQGSLLTLHISSKGINVWGKRAGTVLYDDLRIQCAARAEQVAYTEEITAAQLADFPADALLLHVQKDEPSLLAWHQLQQSGPWQKLHAVQQGHVYFSSGYNWLAEPMLEHTANRHYMLLQDLDRLFRAL